jgi:hypothetical protein
MRTLIFLPLFMSLGPYLVGEEILYGKKHILLTGETETGKSTIIRAVIASFARSIKGTWAEEENIRSEQIGFILHT